MKTKKFLSSITALAIAASTFAGFAVTANAADPISTQMNVVDQNFNDMDAINNPFANWITDGIGTTDKDQLTIEGNALSLSANSTNNFNAVLNMAPVGKSGETTTISFDIGKNRSNGYYVGVPFVFYNSNNESLFTFVAFSNGYSGLSFYLKEGKAYEEYSDDFSGYTVVAENLSFSSIMKKVSITVEDLGNGSATVSASVEGNTANINLSNLNKTDIAKMTVYPKKSRDAGDQNRAWIVDNFVVNGYVDLYESGINLKDSTGNVISGSEVTVGGISAPDNNGSYIINLPEGTYDYNIVSTEYPTKSGQITVSKDNATNIIDITLSSGSNITISTVPGAEILINDVTQTADDLGQSVFNLEDGNYTVTVKADGYFNKTQELVVSGGVAESGSEVTLTKLYNITYSVDSDKGTPSVTESLVSQDAKPLIVPTVSDTNTQIGGYAFLGWSLTENGALVDPSQIAVSSDTVYYAVFSDEITYSVKYYPIADSNIYGSFITDGDEIVLKSSTYRGFLSFDIDTENAVGATMNIYATRAKRPASGGRVYNITFESTKTSGWNADTVNDGDGWLKNIGGSKETLSSIAVTATSDMKSDTDVAGWYSGEFNSFSGINNLYVNTGTGADIAFSSKEGSNPEYIEVFYTGSLYVAPTATYKLINEFKTETDNTAEDKGSAYNLFVTPGTDTIETVTVKVNGTSADKVATTKIESGSAVFAIAVNALSSEVTSITAVLNNEDYTATEKTE